MCLVGDLEVALLRVLDVWGWMHGDLFRGGGVEGSWRVG